jgi:PAS domain-containing protein
MPSQKDDEAQRARDLFESLAESSMIGIYLVQDGKFVLGNPLFERCTGYRIDELLGMASSACRPPREICQPSQPYVTPHFNCQLLQRGNSKYGSTPSRPPGALRA